MNRFEFTPRAITRALPQLLSICCLLTTGVARIQAQTPTPQAQPPEQAQPPQTPAEPTETGTATEPAAAEAATNPAETAAASDPAAAEAVTAPASSPDLRQELEQLRAEVAELRSKQEDAELAALMNDDDAGAGQDAFEPYLRMYGFSDFGFDKWFVADSSDSILLFRPTPAGTFVFGNFNLYVDASPVENWRTLAEVRLTLAPHGEELQLDPPLGTGYQRYDSTAFDWASPASQSQLRMSGIYVERAYTQYTFSNLFKLKAGMFLNPFGIWNIDHGSPTLITLMLPSMIAGQMFPMRLIGLNLYGSKFFGAWELGYAVHVSNGRTPLDFTFTEDKGIGARLYLANEGDYGRLVLGASGYHGRYVDAYKALKFQADNLVDLERVVDYTENVLGLDLAFDTGGLRFRSEAAFRWVAYKDGKHELGYNTTGLAYLPNRLEWNWYAIVAYRTPWRLEPFISAELASKAFTMPRYALPAQWSTPDVATMNYSVGLNVEITPHTLLKTQLAWEKSFKRGFRATPEGERVQGFILFVRGVQTF